MIRDYLLVSAYNCSIYAYGYISFLSLLHEMYKREVESVYGKVTMDACAKFDANHGYAGAHVMKYIRDSVSHGVRDMERLADSLNTLSVEEITYKLKLCRKEEWIGRTVKRSYDVYWELMYFLGKE